MNLSVLLPTRNGATYLPGVIESVLSEESDRFELVVADNANEDGTPEIVARYADDPRVVSVRSSEPLSVTDNWNLALATSRGDYFLMLGDDDYVLPGWLPRIMGTLEAHGWPACLTYNAYGFIAPGALSDGSSFGSPSHFKFPPEIPSEGALSAETRRAILESMFRYRQLLPLNMQCTVVSRSAAEELPFGLFRAPFPDHYGLMALMLRAERWVVSRMQPLIVGVSPKSFGHFVYTDQQDEGLAYLGIESDFEGRLPGNELLNATSVWLAQLKRDYPLELEGIEISRADYVLRQLNAWVRQTRYGQLDALGLLRRLRLLDARDLAALVSASVQPRNLALALDVLSRRASSQQRLWRHPLERLSGIQTIREFAELISARAASETPL
jgi:glycosyltransferase involved in cell wall biosynthesis